MRDACPKAETKAVSTRSSLESSDFVEDTISTSSLNHGEEAMNTCGKSLTLRFYSITWQ